MEYKKYDINDYKLHIIKTKKFIKTLIEVKYRYNLTEKKYNELMLLSRLLGYSTKKYNTNQLLNKELKKNYNSYISTSTVISGNNIIRTVSLEVLNDNIFNDNILDKGLEILNEVLYNPNINNKEFDNKAFDIIYKEIKNEIKEVKENHEIYATLLMLKNMNKNAPYAIPKWGNINILKEINTKKLYDIYIDAITNCNVDIFVIGDINEKEIKTKLENIFKPRKINTSDYTCYYDIKTRKNVKEIIKEKNTNQAKLVIGLDFINLTPFERKYVLGIYSYILGGSPTSKLFKNFREKHSLAYYASSKSYVFDNILIISTGIDKNNYMNALNLIKKYIKDMEKDIDNSEFKQAIEKYINNNNESFDYNWTILHMYHNSILRENEKVDEINENIKKIKLDDLKRTAKKAKLNTIFLYGGDSNEKN